MPDRVSATPAVARQKWPGLSVAQLNAVDLLAVGRTDADVAATAGVHRVTVTRRRLYSPASLLRMASTSSRR